MNIKVAAFTVSEKSSNNRWLFQKELIYIHMHTCKSLVFGAGTIEEFFADYQAHRLLLQML